MLSIRMLVSALALTLLAVSVGSWSDGNLSGSELTELYNSPVYLAERMRRPKGSSSSFGYGSYVYHVASRFGSFPLDAVSHTGVRVTLDDSSQWLVHKGKGYGISSDTVVTRADQMSSDWRVERTGDFQGRKTVGDFVRTGGPDYNLIFDNCHCASSNMMNQ